MENLDPNKIRVSIKTETVGRLFKLLENDLKSISKDLRRGFGDELMSVFVEAVIARMPIAPILVQETDQSHGDRQTYIWQLKVNTQLLAIIYAFSLNYFSLQNLRFLPSFENLFWTQMPSNICRRILETNVVVTVIDIGTPEKIAEEIIWQYKQQLK